MILFYSKGEEKYRYLSNFYLCPLTYNGQVWPSAEHLYHGLKYANLVVREQVRLLPTPQAARSFRHDSYDPRFHGSRERIMHGITRMKYQQNPELAVRLLSTGSQELVHYAPWGDTYWGVGKDRVGMNMQGRLIMEIRAELQKGERHDCPV